MTSGEGGGPPLVVDASVALQWVAPEATSGLAAGLRDGRLTAPDLLIPECANALWKKAARGEFTVAEARHAALTLATAPVKLVATPPLLERAVLIAIELDHPAYDCFYLALTEALGTVCVSADHRLARIVATRAGARYATLLMPLTEIHRLRH